MKWLIHIFGGRTMAALNPGTTAPDFALPTMDGKRFSLPEALSRGPVVAAFFKVSCPVCQYAFPFLERIYRGRTRQDIAMYAISQDDAESTREFDGEFGITFPTLLDTEEEGYPASNAYGLSHVPSLFLVEPDGRISLAFSGFDKNGMEELGRKLGKEPFEPGERVPEGKAG